MPEVIADCPSPSRSAQNFLVGDPCMSGNESRKQSRILRIFLMFCFRRITGTFCGACTRSNLLNLSQAAASCAFVVVPAV